MKIINYFNKTPFSVFVLLSFIICSFYAIVFEPITWQAQGDFPAYNELAKQFLGTSTDNIDLSHRQPLYSLLIVPFLAVFGEQFFVYPLMWFQFFLVFCSSILVYNIFEELNIYKNLPFIAGILYLFNISTMHYGFNILSETLALFLYVTIIYFLVTYFKYEANKTLILLGVLNGLLVLARFNTLGLPLVLMLGLFIIHYYKHHFDYSLKIFKNLALFSIGAIMVLGSWSIYNYYERDFFGIFPNQHMGQRWAIPATINYNNVVSNENERVLGIFLAARESQLSPKNDMVLKKGSFLEYRFFQTMYFGMKPKVNGYKVYLHAQPTLLDYHDLPNTSEGINLLGEKLQPFYAEIKQQNKSELFKYRLYSIFETFRVSASTLPVKEKINLNILPSGVFKAYKLLGFSINFLTFVISVFVSIYILYNLIANKATEKQIMILLIILIIAYFPIVHFYANVLGDANRFKFPSEPIIFGLFVYYLYRSLHMTCKTLSQKSF